MPKTYVDRLPETESLDDFSPVKSQNLRTKFPELKVHLDAKSPSNLNMSLVTQPKSPNLLQPQKSVLNLSGSFMNPDRKASHDADGAQADVSENQ